MAFCNISDIHIKCLLLNLKYTIISGVAGSGKFLISSEMINLKKVQTFGIILLVNNFPTHGW